ncbi:HipA domain-containing protein [Bdellovibrionota bacterium FG-2]
MKRSNQRRIEVCAHWAGLTEPTVMGILYIAAGRGKDIFSFEYDRDWLKGSSARLLDPQLGLYKGQQYAQEARDNFGVFLDSSPDRWGRVLMQRREAQQAREQKRFPKPLYESDYLLGVYDGHRLGALRFRTDSQSSFLNDNKAHAAPPFTSLRELENASLELERENAEDQPQYSTWLDMLIAPGSSLGGARPKASVVDNQERLWIAKFPSAQDEADVGLWEDVVHRLAKTAGIVVAEASARRFGSRHHTFVSRRFDRDKNGVRLHFASAMTLLNHSDGDGSDTGASYLEFVTFMAKESAQPTRDLEQLWRRIAFNICVSNTDDHLRNHGFILHSNGWELAPAYDMNPVATGEGLHLNISESENAQDLDLALSVAEYFRLKKPRAEKIIQEVIKAVRPWRKMASAVGIPKRDQDRMARAFRIAES